VNRKGSSVILSQSLIVGAEKSLDSYAVFVYCSIIHLRFMQFTLNREMGNYFGKWHAELPVLPIYPTAGLSARVRGFEKTHQRALGN
jgi:hypothetical protein